LSFIICGRILSCWQQRLIAPRTSHRFAWRGASYPWHTRCTSESNRHRPACSAARSSATANILLVVRLCAASCACDSLVVLHSPASRSRFAAPMEAAAKQIGDHHRSGFSLLISCDYSVRRCLSSSCPLADRSAWRANGTKPIRDEFQAGSPHGGPS